MNKAHKSHSQAERKQRAATQAKPAPQTARKGFTAHCSLRPRTARLITYALGFLALFSFLYWGYGDVLSRTEQESYVSTSPDTMHYVLSQPNGTLYWLARWGLLVFKSTLLGAAVLALVYTLTARFADYALRLPRNWEGLGFIIPLAQIGWIVWRGTNLYYKNEPSLFIIVAATALLVAALVATAVWFVCRKRQRSQVQQVRPYGLLLTLLLTGGTTWATLHYNQNEILTARLQNMMWKQQWNEMVSEARTAQQPSRSVAAYHAIALIQTDQLLEGMFDIPYDFPKVRLDSLTGSGEYGLFVTDCNFHAGLLNAAYRGAMDGVVMDGPRLSCFKRMAICALLNGEKELCSKYLKLIENSPFESDFVQKYQAMLRDDKLIEADEELQHVKALYPKEDHFEQNYRSPAFLGYNVGLMEGSDATLTTSAAACLYSKDLQNFLPRAQILAQKGRSFPACMQQAIAIMALQQPQLLNQFPQVGRFVSNEITSFLLDAKPYLNDRLALRHNLRERWLGTYVYYYYTENNDPNQVVQPSSAQENAGVN